MHFIGGASVSVTYFLCIKYFESRKFLKINNFFRFLFVLSLVSLTAVLWECYEFSMDYFFDMDLQKGIADTMSDFLFGILGGVFAYLFLTKTQNHY